MSTVVLSAASGLANRLRALVGGRVLAEALGAELRVHWPANGACDAPFGDLFEVGSWPDVHVATTDAEEPAAEDEIRIDGCPWFTEIWRRHASEVLEAREFDRRAVASLRGLRPVRPVRERVEAFLRDSPLSDCVGVHIRSTDNVPDYDRIERSDPNFERHRVSSLEGFEQLVDACVAAGQGVFLCTDNASVERAFRARHPSIRGFAKDYDERGLAHFTSRHYGRWARLRRIADRLRPGDGAESSFRTTPVADALVDLLLLGHCGEIVGTYYSSFSEIASLVGDRPLAIVEGDRVVPHAFTEEIRCSAARDRAVAGDA